MSETLESLKWRCKLYSTVAKKVGINILAIFLLSLSSTVPLLNLDLRTVPLSVLNQIPGYEFLTTNGVITAHFSPFLLSIIPYVQAQIVVSVAVGRDALRYFPPAIRVLKKDSHKPAVRMLINLMMGGLGTLVAFMIAVPVSHSICTLTGFGTLGVISVICALIAGSSMHYFIAQMITASGLGNGISFIYLIHISSGMSAKLNTLMQQGLPPVELVKLLAVASVLVMACTSVTTLKFNLQLVSHSITELYSGSDGERSLERVLQTDKPPSRLESALETLPLVGTWVLKMRQRAIEHAHTSDRKIAIMLCPNTVMILIVLHMIPLLADFVRCPMMSPLVNQWAAFLYIQLFTLFGIGASVTDTGEYISQVNLGVAGFAPGEQTSEFFMRLFVVLRSAGGLALVGLYFLSTASERYFTSVAGVSVGLTELLIVISSLISSSRLVSRALAETRTLRRARGQLDSYFT